MDESMTEEEIAAFQTKLLDTLAWLNTPEGIESAREKGLSKHGLLTRLVEYTFELAMREKVDIVQVISDAMLRAGRQAHFFEGADPERERAEMVEISRKIDDILGRRNRRHV